MINFQQSAKNSINKIKNILSRGVVQTVSDNSGTQSMQVSLLAKEAGSNIEHPQEYGFTSNAPGGSEVIAAFFGGNRDSGTIITVFNKSARVSGLQGGEVCIYDDLGTKILLKRGNKIEITATSDIKIISPTVRIEGNLEVTGDIVDKKGSNVTTVAQMRSIYNSHTHQETGSVTNGPNQTQ